MQAFLFALFWLISSVAATGFIYPAPAGAKAKNLTITEGDSIIVAYDVDPSAIEVVISIICETPINTDIVPVGINPWNFENTGLAQYEILPETFDGNNTDFIGNVCFLTLENATWSSCYNHSVNFLPNGSNLPFPSDVPVDLENGTQFGNSTWITFLKNNSNASPTTLSGAPSALGSLSTAIVATPSFSGRPTSASCNPGTFTFPSISLTNYASQLAAEATATSSSGIAWGQNATSGGERRRGTVGLGGVVALVGLGYIL